MTEFYDVINDLMYLIMIDKSIFFFLMEVGEGEGVGVEEVWRGGLVSGCSTIGTRHIVINLFFLILLLENLF